MKANNMKASLIPKSNRKLVYEYLFTEGVLVVRKDTKAESHKEINVPNLHILMIMKSLKSLGYVNEKFNWQHHYYILNNPGVEYLREYLSLPSYVFPSTFTKLQRQSVGTNRGEKGPGAGNFQPRASFGRSRAANVEA